MNLSSFTTLSSFVFPAPLLLFEVSKVPAAIFEGSIWGGLGFSDDFRVYISSEMMSLPNSGLLDPVSLLWWLLSVAPGLSACLSAGTWNV